MTTPTEDEARALIERLGLVERDGYLSATYLGNEHVGELVREAADTIGSLLASRVSTPPSEAMAQALAFATKERDEIRGRYAQTGGSPARYLGYADACDDIIALLQGEATFPVPAVPVPPTDEDEREALAVIVKQVSQKFGGPSMAEFANDPPIRKHYATADAILAAGFRRQAVSTPETEWEYGIRMIGTSIWAPTTAEHVAKVQAWHNGTYEFARRTAPGPWEPVPAEGEA